MTYALSLLFAVALALFLAHIVLGYAAAYAIAYGAVIAMAASISGTFFWLWHRRQTPLALGMGFSWAGTTGVLGWWWVYEILQKPEAMVESAGLFLFVACYFVGAVLHFQVVGRSLGLGTAFLLLPVAGVLLLGGLAFAG